LYGGAQRRVSNELRAVRRLTRPFLHAERLAFTHPTTGERLEFTAPLPPDLREIVEAIEPSLLAMLEAAPTTEDEDI
jgi:23S rRNA pseudouridine1911/1915/1917 synthase